MEILIIFTNRIHHNLPLHHRTSHVSANPSSNLKWSLHRILLIYCAIEVYQGSDKEEFLHRRDLESKLNDDGETFEL